MPSAQLRRCDPRIRAAGPHHIRLSALSARLKVRDCLSDFELDGVIDVSDLLVVIAGWNNPYGVDDLLLVISEWNMSCP